MDDDLHKYALKFLCTLACCVSWFALSWMLILNDPTVTVWVFWGMFGLLSIAGLIGKPGGKVQ